MNKSRMQYGHKYVITISLFFFILLIMDSIAISEAPFEYIIMNQTRLKKKKNIVSIDDMIVFKTNGQRFCDDIKLRLTILGDTKCKLWNDKVFPDKYSGKQECSTTFRDLWANGCHYGFIENSFGKKWIFRFFMEQSDYEKALNITVVDQQDLINMTRKHNIKIIILVLSIIIPVAPFLQWIRTKRYLWFIITIIMYLFAIANAILSFFL